MTKFHGQLAAEKREIFGRQVRGLRRQGWTPATIYGKGFGPISVQFDSKELNKLFEEVGESGLVEMTVGEEKLPILFKNPQYHPVGSHLLHIDGYKVNLKEKITATVPIELVGESPAVKLGNILIQISDEVEIEALPADLPEKFEVDISGVENLEEVITMADLKIDKEILTIKSPADQVIVKLEEPKEEIVEEPVVEPGEVPATEQQAEGEGGEAASEGQGDKARGDKSGEDKNPQGTKEEAKKE